MYGAAPLTISSKGSEFSGLFFGGKYLTGPDRCGKCSNEIVTLHLTTRKTIGVKIIRPNRQDLQSMGSKVYNTVLQEGTVPPRSYGGRLTQISSNDETSNTIEGNSFHIQILIYSYQSLLAILVGGIMQPNIGCSSLDVLTKDINLWEEELVSGIYILTFTRKLDRFHWRKIKLEIEKMLPTAFHGQEYLPDKKCLIIFGGLTVKENKELQRRPLAEIYALFPEEEKGHKLTVVTEVEETFHLSATSTAVSTNGDIYFWGGYGSKAVSTERKTQNVMDIVGKLSVSLDLKLVNFSMKKCGLAFAGGFSFLASDNTVFISCGTVSR